MQIALLESCEQRRCAVLAARCRRRGSACARCGCAIRTSRSSSGEMRAGRGAGAARARCTSGSRRVFELPASLPVLAATRCLRRAAAGRRSAPRYRSMIALTTIYLGVAADPACGLRRRARRAWGASCRAAQPLPTAGRPSYRARASSSPATFGSIVLLPDGGTRLEFRRSSTRCSRTSARTCAGATGLWSVARAVPLPRLLVQPVRVVAAAPARRPRGDHQRRRGARRRGHDPVAYAATAARISPVTPDSKESRHVRIADSEISSSASSASCRARRRPARRGASPACSPLALLIPATLFAAASAQQRREHPCISRRMAAKTVARTSSISAISPGSANTIHRSRSQKGIAGKVTVRRDHRFRLGELDRRGGCSRVKQPDDPQYGFG